MPSTIRVEAARIPDRNRLLEALRNEGLDAEPEDEIGIVVPLGGGDGELFHQVEGVIFSVGAPFVPIEHDGVIYIRPPVGEAERSNSAAWPGPAPTHSVASARRSPRRRSS